MIIIRTETQSTCRYDVTYTSRKYHVTGWRMSVYMCVCVCVYVYIHSVSEDCRCRRVGRRLSASVRRRPKSASHLRRRANKVLPAVSTSIIPMSQGRSHASHSSSSSNIAMHCHGRYGSSKISSPTPDFSSQGGSECEFRKVFLYTG